MSEPFAKPARLTPRRLHKEQRLHDICDAIIHHRQGSYIIPAEWFDEAAELARWLAEQEAQPNETR